MTPILFSYLVENGHLKIVEASFVGIQSVAEVFTDLGYFVIDQKLLNVGQQQPSLITTVPCLYML